jgi:hypothetical protein
MFALGEALPQWEKSSVGTRGHGWSCGILGRSLGNKGGGRPLSPVLSFPTNAPEIYQEQRGHDTEIWKQHFIGSTMAQWDNSQNLSPGHSRVITCIH